VKRIFAALTATIILISLLAACAGGGGSSSSSSSSSASSEPETVTEAVTETAAEPAPEESTDWRTPYAEPVKVTIVNSEFADVAFFDGQTVFDNIWTRRWKEMYNVDVVTEWVSAEYETKLNVSIASNQLPDMFWCNNVQFNQLRDANMLADITADYDKWASPSLQIIMGRDQEMFETGYKDGKLYGMPRLHYGYECEPNHLWIRRDHMSEAGNPELKTVAQWEDLMRTFKEKYGQPYAMSMDKDMYPFWALNGAFHSSGRPWGGRMWLDDGNGKIMCNFVQPELKTALGKWADWYKEGLIRQDFMTVDGDMMQQDFVNGNVSMCGGANWYGWVWQNVCENFGPEAIMDAYEVPTIDGKPCRFPIGFVNDGYGVVSKGFANSEIIVKLINDYAYVLNEAAFDGHMTPEETIPYAVEQHHVVGPFKVLLRHYEDVRAVRDAIATGVEKFPSGYAMNYYFESIKWTNDQDIAGLGRYVQQGHDMASIYQATFYLDQGRYDYTKTWGPSPQSELDNGSILNDIIFEGATKIVSGAESVDHWDTVVANWLSAGGQEMTDDVNAMYGN